MIDRRHGRIINVVSALGIPTNAESTPSPYAPAYSSSKAGVIALTQSLGTMAQAHGVECLGSGRASSERRCLKKGRGRRLEGGGFQKFSAPR